MVYDAYVSVFFFYYLVLKPLLFLSNSCINQIDIHVLVGENNLIEEQCEIINKGVQVNAISGMSGGPGKCHAWDV